MARILTGIQSSGKPHIGNIIGAIEPALALAQKTTDAAFFFIADMHALTSLRDGKTMRDNTLQVAATWLACGLNVEKDFFYRQSKVPQVTELAWYLNCYAPYPMLANAHSFKDKSENLSSVNVGLFAYPVLMTADILLYDAEQVPVGKDQKQHLEIAKDIALAFNRQYENTFVVPEPIIDENVMTVPGTDGRKMSKSYNNYINIFASDAELKKSVMSIVTDSKSLEDSKNPDECNVFKLYELVASPEDVLQMRENYVKGGYGYGHAKTALLEAMKHKYEFQRTRFNELINHPQLVEDFLATGEARAHSIANQTLQRVRNHLGF